MPSYTTNTILARAQVAYPDLPQATALDYLNDVRRDVLFRLGIVTSANTITVTANDPDYAVTPSSVRIHYVAWATSSTSEVRKLVGYSRQEMDDRRPAWRTSQEEGEPLEYCLDWADDGQLEVHLWPAPNTTSSGGYPALYVYTDTAIDVALGSTFYMDIASDEVLVTGIQKLWARDKHLKDYPMRERIYERELSSASMFNKNRSVDVPASLMPDYMRIGRGGRGSR